MTKVNRENMKRMRKSELKKMKSSTNWARLVSEDKKEKDANQKIKKR